MKLTTALLLLFTTLSCAAPNVLGEIDPRDAAAEPEADQRGHNWRCNRDGQPCFRPNDCCSGRCYRDSWRYARGRCVPVPTTRQITATTTTRTTTRITTTSTTKTATLTTDTQCPPPLTTFIPVEYTSKWTSKGTTFISLVTSTSLRLVTIPCNSYTTTTTSLSNTRNPTLGTTTPPRSSTSPPSTLTTCFYSTFPVTRTYSVSTRSYYSSKQYIESTTHIPTTYIDYAQTYTCTPYSTAYDTEDPAPSTPVSSTTPTDSSNPSVTTTSKSRASYATDQYGQTYTCFYPTQTFSSWYMTSAANGQQGAEWIYTAYTTVADYCQTYYGPDTFTTTTPSSSFASLPPPYTSTTTSSPTRSSVTFTYSSNPTTTAAVTSTPPTTTTPCTPEQSYITSTSIGTSVSGSRTITFTSVVTGTLYIDPACAFASASRS